MRNILILIIFLPVITFGQENVEWITRMGGSHPNDGYDIGRKIIHDNEGNLYVVGEFTDSIVIDGIKLISNGKERDIFLAKLNPKGKVLWLKNFGGIEADCYSGGICIDANSNIYLTGNFKGEISIGNSVYKNNEWWDIFLLKLSNDGQLIWSRAFIGDGGNKTSSITNDKEGNIYITGYYSKNLTFDNYFLEGPTARSDLFVVKFNSNGNVIWAKSTRSNANIFGICIKNDNKGHLYLTGFMQDSVYFDSHLLVSSGFAQAYISKIDTYSGEFIWAVGGGGDGWSEGNALAIDSEDNIVLSGWYRNEIYFGNNSVSNGGDDNGPDNIFIVKFDSTGRLIWIKTTEANKYSDINDITTNKKDEIFLTGNFNGILAIEDSVYQSKFISFSDIFVLKFNKNGDFGWFKSFGADNRPRFYDKGFGITSFNNSLYITGMYSGDIWFDEKFLYCNGGSDIFITKLSETNTDDTQRNILLIYPNPSLDIINVKFKNPESIEYQLKVYNSLSYEIFSKDVLDSDEINIDLKNCPSGMYTLQFLNLENFSIINKKIVKIN